MTHQPDQPTHILDPYPERATSLGGVRQPPTLPHPSPGSHGRLATAHHFPFAASLKLRQQANRASRLPIAATILSVLGQSALAYTTAAGTVSPVVAVIAAISLLACCLLLIVAQCVMIASTRIAEAASSPGGGS